MLHGLYASAAGAMVQDARVSVIANNLANVSTAGFKEDFSYFMARAHEAVEAGRAEYGDAIFRDVVGGGVFLRGTQSNLAQGFLTHTENPYDIAIDGEGFMAVTDGSKSYYTRAGQLSVDSEGYLATIDGQYRFLGTDGELLRVDRNTALQVASV